MKKELIKTGFNYDDVISFGNMFLLGNGRYGYRCTLEEYSKKEFCKYGKNFIYSYIKIERLFAKDILKDVTYQVNKDGVLVVDAVIAGTKHTADMEVYLTNRGEPTDIGVTVNKTTGEKLENAGLNTLLGMGMAFAILIIISLIISLFPVFFGGGNKKKKESDKEIAQKAMDNTINQIAEQEDLSCDAELVAVIAAAIAAYEGSGSTDGFRVRSIRKVNNNWKKH